MQPLIKPVTSSLFIIISICLLLPASPAAAPSIESIQPGVVTAGKKAEVLVKISGAAAEAYVVLEAAAQPAMLESSPLDVRQGVNYGGQRKGFIQGNILYVADWFSGLHMYDITNPEQPRLVSTFHTPGSAKGVVVQGRYAFIADDDYGLQIIDVGIPSEPEWVAGLATSGLAYTPVIDGGLLYLASHRGGVHIIDIEKPSEPSVVGGFDTPNKAWSVAVENDVAYVADAASGLLIFDVSDTTRPRQIGQFNPGGNAEDVAVENGFAYATFFDKGLYILDVRRPAEPTVRAHVSTPGNARGVAVDDGRVYVADWQAGIHIFHARDPDRPVRLGGFDTPGAAWGLQVKGYYAYVFDWWGGLTALNIRDARKPVLVGRYPEQGAVQRLATSGGFLYALNSAGLQVFDANNPLNPIWSTGLDMAGGATELEVRDGLVALVAGNELVLVDTGNPFQLRRVATLSLSARIRSIAIGGERVFIADEAGRVRTYELANPGEPTLLGGVKANVDDMWWQKNRLYVADRGQGLLAYDVSGHEAKLLTTLEAGGVPERVRGADGVLFARLAGGPIAAFDIASDAFSLLGHFGPLGEVVDMQVDGNSLYVLTDDVLLAIDAADPSHMRLASRYALKQPALHLAIGNATAYLAGGKAPKPIRLLPTLLQSLDDGGISLTIPKDVPAGLYQVQLISASGEAVGQSKAFRVKKPVYSKPKLSKEAYDKLLKQNLGP